MPPIECEADVSEQWNGPPEDEPGKQDRERRMYDMADAQETASHLGVSVLDVLQWDGRLSVRTISEPTADE